MNAPKIRTTSSNDLVICCVCESDVMKRDACGVGIGGQFTWTCTNCIANDNDSMDRAFSPLNDLFYQLQASARKAGFR